jgi:1-acyl-sn-glycerol-3-phosphate acyltransferase
MLRFLPGPIKGGLSLFLICSTVTFLAIFVYILAILKLILPFQPIRKVLTQAIIAIGSFWISLNNLWLRTIVGIEWDIQGLEGLQDEQWYLLISNHQSWPDVFILQYIFNYRIPFLKFFVKDELKWVPIMGLVWWALDCPFMKRYSKEYLAKNPHMKGKDLETTKKACERFKEMPISVISFIEGTRLTPQKQQKQNSPYRHLLKPKAGGIALVLSAMGEQFTSILDVSIAYDTTENNLWQFWSGKVKKISIHIAKYPVPREMLGQDYENDPQFREKFQAWLHETWLAKDQQLEVMKQKMSSS